jgi:hypothetical protein
MFKDLQVTLYEVFGYLIPGMVNLWALVILYWALFFPAQIVAVDIPTGELWVAFLVVAYIAGHMAQAVGNLVEQKCLKPVEQLVIENTAPDRLPQAVVDACKVKATELTKADMANAHPRLLYRVCDDAVIRSGKIGEREVYVYREGFYRGIFISFSVMAVACVALCIRLFWVTERQVMLAKVQWGVTQWQLVFFAAVSVIWAWLSFRRYRRFGDYRTTHALLGFLTVKEPKKEGGGDEKKGA